MWSTMPLCNLATLLFSQQTTSQHPYHVTVMASDSTNLQRTKPPGKQRIDLLLVERGLVESRERARRLIMAGSVTVNGAVFDKPGTLAAVDAQLAVTAAPQFVSRGGLKLAAALDEFHIDVTGLAAVDVGASTGGFSDCLLQRGVARIFAVDVGYGQLAWKVRSDPRVVVLERTNIRYLEQLPNADRADLAVIDASFIGLALVLPATLRLLKPAAQIVALVKPQFEAGRQQVGKGGVVRDELVHRRVLEEIAALAVSLDLHVAGLTVSPAPGPAGNIEFLIWLKRDKTQPAAGMEITAMIDDALRGADLLRRAAKHDVGKSSV
jgi:23S rRNA (cytidine1920-2'-O)/16S rRNA (cytidine1409-2'-O)-methyltransferase